MRLPVAAKIAFVMAGATTAVGGSPMPPGSSELADQVGLDDRHFVDTHRQIGVEIALLDAAVLQRDGAVQRGRQSEDRAALDLGRDRVRIDRHAAVDGADDAMNPNRPVGRTSTSATCAR